MTSFDLEAHQGLRVLVCGGRYYNDWKFIDRVLDSLKPREVVVGDASGADAGALRWAQKTNTPVKVYKADWKTHGNAAGPIRNGEMLVEDPELVVAFPGGVGTANMMGQARASGVEVIRPVPKVTGKGKGPDDRA